SVECAGFARIGAACKGDFVAFIYRTLLNTSRAGKKAGLLAQADNGVFRLHKLSKCKVRQEVSFPFYSEQYIMLRIVCAHCCRCICKRLSVRQIMVMFA